MNHWWSAHDPLMTRQWPTDDPLLTRQWSTDDPLMTHCWPVKDPLTWWCRFRWETRESCEVLPNRWGTKAGFHSRCLVPKTKQKKTVHNDFRQKKINVVWQNKYEKSQYQQPLASFIKLQKKTKTAEVFHCRKHCRKHCLKHCVILSTEWWFPQRDRNIWYYCLIQLHMSSINTEYGLLGISLTLKKQHLSTLWMV